MFTIEITSDLSITWLHVMRYVNSDSNNNNNNNNNNIDINNNIKKKKKKGDKLNLV